MVKGTISKKKRNISISKVYRLASANNKSLQDLSDSRSL